MGRRGCLRVDIEGGMCFSTFHFCHHVLFKGKTREGGAGWRGRDAWPRPRLLLSCRLQSHLNLTSNLISVETKGPQPQRSSASTLSEERSSQYPHPHFWESESYFLILNCDLLTCVSKLFRTLPALVFSEKVRK